MEQHRQKEDEPEPETGHEPGRHHYTIEEGVDRQSDHRLERHATLVHLLMMSLLAEMEVRRDGVFCKLKQQVPGKQPGHRHSQFALPLPADLRHDLQDHHCQQKTGTHRRQALQEAVAWCLAVSHEKSTQQISESRQNPNYC